METLGKICLVIFIMVLSVIMNGYLFMTLWRWFIVYSFHVSPLSMIQSIGIMCFLTCLKGYKKEADTSFEASFIRYIEYLVWYGLSFFIAYVITFFQ